MQHPHAVENLTGFSKAFLYAAARLFKQILELAGVGTSSLLALQALLDETENTTGDFLRGVIIGLAGQCTRLKPKAFSQAVGQCRLRVSSIAHNRLSSGGGRT